VLNTKFTYFDIERRDWMAEEALLTAVNAIINTVRNSCHDVSHDLTP